MLHCALLVTAYCMHADDCVRFAPIAQHQLTDALAAAAAGSMRMTVCMQMIV
jgi:hypothetical protein